jgi:2-phospho-L-lactate guanylyltransferase
MSDWAVVPVKSIANGKSRLAPILGRPRRQRLNRALLYRTLALASTIISKRRLIVVSHCEETLSLAQAIGVTTLREPRGIGLNRALGMARDHAVSRGASGVLILPSDLPLARPADLRAVLRASRRRKSIVICRDRHGRGTNALYLRHPSNFRFRFGDDSAVAHEREAAIRGLHVMRLDLPGLGFDLDTPTDYRNIRGLGLLIPASITRNFR